jgi:hypothetical protein
MSKIKLSHKLFGIFSKTKHPPLRRFLPLADETECNTLARIEGVLEKSALPAEVILNKITYS